MNKKWLLALLIIVILGGAGGGYYYYTTQKVQAATNGSESTLQTSVARQGELTILASASGQIIPASQISVGFSESGTLIELNVQIGSQVKSGDVLACLQTNTTEEELAASVADAELSVLKTQASIDDLYESAATARTNAISNITTYAGAVRDAQYTLDNFTIPTELKGMEPMEALDYAKAKLDAAREAFEPYKYYSAENDTREELLTALSLAQSLYDTAVKQLEYVYALQVAQTNLDSARNDYERYKDGPDADELALAQAELTNAQAKLALVKETKAVEELLAPMDGTVLAVDANLGESVGAAAFITLANLQQPMIEIYLDETDLDKIAVGYLTEVYFDAYPDDVFQGHVVQVNPSLQSMSGVQTIQAWMVLDGEDISGFNLPVGLNASVDVIAARAENAVLIPIEALRDLGDGAYAVFVIENGEPVLRMVEIGLQDLTSVQITSGLEAGETVSTGIVATK